MKIDKNVLILIIILPIIGLCFFGGKLMKDKIVSQVIDQLKREYTPGPYQPGFEPDKVPPNLLKPPQKTKEFSPADWNKMWESQRDATPPNPSIVPGFQR